MRTLPRTPCRRSAAALLLALTACASGPDEIEVADDLAGVRRALAAGEPEVALRVVRQVEDREGATGESRRLEAQALGGLRRYREALATLDTVVPEPDEARAVTLERIDLLRAADRPQEALRHLEVLLEERGDDRETAQLLYRRGELHQSLDDSRAALADFREARALAPDWWQPPCAEAAVHLRKGDAELALSVLESRPEDLRSHAELAHLRALVAEAQDRPDEALDWYGRAVEIEPGHWQSHLNRALLLESRGLRAEALSAYQQGFAGIPGPDLARREAVRARIEELRRRR